MSVSTGVAAAVATLALAGGAVLLAEERVEQVGAPTDEWIAPVEADEAEIWAVGDADPPKAEGVARLIRRTDPDRILYLGDVYPRGTKADFSRWAKPWGRLVERMAPTPGNHEWPQARSGYEPYWKGVTGTKPPIYYAFEAAGWEILSVNSEQVDTRAAESWLRYRTQAGGDCRIAFWHRPRISAGHHRHSDAADDLWAAVKGRAKLVLNGHDHNMQRFRRDGMIEFVSGAGGRKLYPVDERYRGLRFSDDKRFGALHLSLSPGEANWRFVAVGGRVLDKGTASCRQ